jgi:uncharacterized protein YggE
MQDMRVLFAVLAILPLSAQVSENRLTVTGDAEIKVAPDRVVISVGVESRSPQLATAKTRNDTAIAAILAAAKNEQVAVADVQTDFIEISPVYQSRDTNESRENYLIDYYRVNKTVAITLRDVTRFERLLTAILGAGANRVYGVEFQTSELRKYRDQARDLAVKAAVEKAQAMAGAAGLKVGKPESISAYNQGGGAAYGRMRGPTSNMSQNVMSTAGGDGETSGTFAPGRISVNASVTLTFRLLP